MSSSIDLRDSWQAAWEGGLLHVSGTTDLYPNDFSTAHLDFVADDVRSGTRIYRLGFARDKEPYCDADRVGPVHHYDPSVRREIGRIRIVSADGTELGTCAVPQRIFDTGRA